MDAIRLLRIAKEAAERSYSPYSDFPVGAALLCSNGKVYRGTNIENRSFGLTNCAERTALFAALSEGERAFTAVSVVNTRTNTPVSPCGACRQVLSEFVDENFTIYYSGNDLQYRTTTMKELLPQDSLHELKNGPTG